MKKIGILIFVVAIVVGLVVTNLFSFGRVSGKLFDFPIKFGAEHGSGRVASDVRDVREFHGIDVGGIFKVEVVIGPSSQVEVQADDNLLPLINTRVDDDGILHIESERRIKSDNDILVRVTAIDVDALDVSGASNVKVTGLQNQGLSVDASGASRVKIAGKASKVTFDVSGATKVDASDLTAEDATVDASGASHVFVNVTGRLNADASGASNVTYSGSPTVEKKTSGASRVTSKE